MDDIHWFYLAYAVIWGGLFLYLLKLHFDQLRLARDVELLKEVSDDRERDEG